MYLCRGRGELEVWFLPIRHPTLQEGGWMAPLCGRFALGKERVFIGQEAGHVSGSVWAARKISRSAGFDHRTIQPLTIRYTDYAIRAIFKDISGKTRRFQLLAYFIL